MRPTPICNDRYIEDSLPGNHFPISSQLNKEFWINWKSILTIFTWRTMNPGILIKNVTILCCRTWRAYCPRPSTTLIILRRLGQVFIGQNLNKTFKWHHKLTAQKTVVFSSQWSPDKTRSNWQPVSNKLKHDNNGFWIPAISYRIWGLSDLP